MLWVRSRHVFGMGFVIGAVMALVLPAGGCNRGVGIAGNNNGNMNENDNADGGPGPVCGDGLRETPEQCDGDDLAGQDCAALGFDGGDLACGADCTFDQSGCTGGCGNSVIEGGEQCDGDDLGAWDCWTAAQHLDGDLACDVDCNFDTSGCHTCGDAVIDGPETCDGTNLGGETCVTLGFVQGTLACDAQCGFDTSACEGPSTCGNGVLDPPEECDGVELDGETCESLGYGQGTLACTAMCTFDHAGCWPSVCTEVSPNNPLGRKPVQLVTRAAADLQVGVEINALVADITPANAGAGEAAMTFDLSAAGHEMAGFVVARSPVTGALDAEVLDVMSGIIGLGFSSAGTRSGGSFVVSHDQYPTVVSTVMTVITAGAVDLSEVRNEILAELLGRPLTDFTFPAPTGHTGTAFAVTFSTQWRGGTMVAVMGGVGLLVDYDAGGDAAMHLTDAGNGSGLAGANSSTDVACNIYNMVQLPQADIIWVMDETGSMTSKLQNIANNAVTFFQTAADYSLDFRIGVVNVEVANNGVFCTNLGQSADHFLGPADLIAFQSCAQEPWGALQQAFGLENGITQGYNAIVNHLPRANQPDRIRPDAHLAIIYVTDERAQELTDTCGGGAGPWTDYDPTCMWSVVGPTVDLLHGVSDPEGLGRAHSIIGPPPASCPDAFQVGQGYLDITNATGGQVHSICTPNLLDPMLRILEDIISSASVVVLPHRPISLSLAVAKEDKTVLPSELVALPRSRTSGFDYRAASNGVVFINQDFSQLPYELVVGYERWMDGELCANGVDDDNDGMVDCADFDCNGLTCGPLGLTCVGGFCVCPGGGTEICDDGVDNDCDGQTDCADANCPTVATETDCGDGFDNDCDGQVDCAEASCDGVGFCEQPEQSCADGLDNDGDGLVDGADWEDCGNPVYAATFDACPGGWIYSGDWQCGTPSGAGPSACVSGTCIGTNLVGDYTNNRAWGMCWATSPAISLATTTSPTLVFDSWLDTENAPYDGVNIQVSSDMGVSWLPHTAVTPAYSSTVDNQQCWAGHTWNTGWQTFQADLSAYNAQTIMIRFQLRTDTSVTEPGWYIDNVRVLD